MSYPNTLASTKIDIVNITKNTKGFKVLIKPMDNVDNIEYYNIYLSDYTYSIEPNSNSNNFLIKQLPFSDIDQCFYYVPDGTGLYYLTVFPRNNFGIESSGVLFTGIIPTQRLIKEISIINCNYYTSGLMYASEYSNTANIKEPYALLGYQLNYSSLAEQDYVYNQGYIYKNFADSFKNKSVKVYTRVIPSLDNNSGILYDQTMLRNTSNDIYSNSYLGTSIQTNFFSQNSIALPDVKVQSSTAYPSVSSENSRYFIFDYASNYEGFNIKNTKYVEAQSSENLILFNPEADTSSSFTQKLLNLTGTTGARPTNYLLISEPGHYNSYYITTEVIDEEGFSSAGGNVNNINDLERYTNQNGYKITKVQHNSISRDKVVTMFKNYKREEGNKITFDIKGELPIDIGLDSVIIIPQKYQENINNEQNKAYSDEFIFLRNLDEIDVNYQKNYSVEMIDAQNETKYKIKTYLNPDSQLLKDSIFSAKIYYLNALQAYSLNLHLNRSGYTLVSLLYYIEHTELIDKYITLNKFIKENQNYTSTIAASYQGVVYFFTPESFPYISWPDQSYRNSHFNKGGARMLDFEYDGVSSGPEFYNYFPLANAQIDDAFPNELKYKTTYRCLDSYKYSSSTILEPLIPEDMPSAGINGSDSYLGAFDPGNIGDIESPNTPDFKSVNYDLNYFKAKNILAVKFVSAGIQKEDAYAVIEFILDIPDAEDFIIQGISGTDVILEKGIKEIDGINYHYFVAKFVSSCGVDNDPILDGVEIDQKNIIDSKKIISFLVYPTKFKIVEDPTDKPFFGDVYLLATDSSNNQFSILKECTFTLLNNDTDCIKGCCVSQSDPIRLRAPFNQFHVLSSFAVDQIGNNYPVGRILETTNNVLGSLSYRYKALSYSTSTHVLKYQKPTILDSTLYFGIICYAEHNVALNKILIYMKKPDDINNISWTGSDLIDSYIFEDVVKNYSIHLDIPNFSFSKRGPQLFNKIRKDYESWIKNGETFAVKILLIDRSGDTLSQVFSFSNEEPIYTTTTTTAAPTTTTTTTAAPTTTTTTTAAPTTTTTTTAAPTTTTTTTTTTAGTTTTPAPIQLIVGNPAYSASLVAIGEWDWYKIVPPSSGSHVITTYGNTDTILELWDSARTDFVTLSSLQSYPVANGTLLAIDDQSAGNLNNALIRYNLNANENYYLKARDYYIGTGNYDVGVTYSGITTFNVTNNGASAYVINGSSNPTLNVIKRFTYTFNVNAPGHPFWIKDNPTILGSANAYYAGVTNNGTDTGTITWLVDINAPNPLYYACGHHSSMTGVINILGS